MKILNKVMFLAIKNYLVALIVTDNILNEEKIKEFINNFNKNVSSVEKIKKFN